MDLRRFAQTQKAKTSSTSRTSASPIAPVSLPSTPVRGAAMQATPHTRLVYPISPVTSPSLSASTAFDWEAARSSKPPPYSSPAARRVRNLRQSDAGTGSPGPATPGGHRRERIVRKKRLIERITALPAAIAFEISLFPYNVPLPASRTSAWLIGGFCHFLSVCVCISRIRSVRDSDLGWEDMYREEEGKSWFDWVFYTTLLLLVTSFTHALYFFTRTRLYQLALAAGNVPSPHAKLVPRPQSPRASSNGEDETAHASHIGPLLLSMLRNLWHGLVVSARFLLNLEPPKDRQTSLTLNGMEKIQELEVWIPSELGRELFAIYSPVHALLWTGVTTANWMLMGIIMVVTTMQIRVTTRSYEQLIKDRAIIAAEVLHEYDVKFVIPHVNPIRKDAAVMTHESEVVNKWGQ